MFCHFQCQSGLADRYDRQKCEPEYEQELIALADDRAAKTYEMNMKERVLSELYTQMREKHTEAMSTDEVKTKPDSLRFQMSTLGAVQEAAEAFLCRIFEGKIPTSTFYGWL